MIFYLLIATTISSILAATLATIIGTVRLQKFSRPLSLTATGLLITLSFTHLLPEAMEGGIALHNIGITCWATVMILIASEMFLSSLHHHSHNEAMKEAMKNGATGLLSGTALHTFGDGVMIASAFLVDPTLGFAVAIAIMAHEVPQQLGDYVILLECGLSRLGAYTINATSFIATSTGGLLGYFILDRVENLLPYALAISASSFIYVSLSDLLPRLKKDDGKHKMGWRFSFLMLGSIIAIILSHMPH